MIVTSTGRPDAMLKSMDDDSHVRTRLCQYEIIHCEKGLEIAKQLVLGKKKGQNVLLEKHSLHSHDIGTNTDKICKKNASIYPIFRFVISFYGFKGCIGTNRESGGVAIIPDSTRANILFF
jgi:hypothetical protein